MLLIQRRVVTTDLKTIVNVCPVTRQGLYFHDHCVS